MIRKSPLKNDTLRSYVKSTDNKERTSLILDSKTRWKSLVAMLERYLELRMPVEKTLIDYKVKNPVSEAENVAVNNIVRALKPVEVGSVNLCSRDSTLLSAEGVFSFIFQELNGQDTVFSKKIRDALIYRLNERRQKGLVGLLKYIKTGKNDKVNRAYDLQPLPNTSALLVTAKHLVTRLTGKNDEIAMPESELSDSECQNEELSQSLVEKLDSAIKKQVTSCQHSTTSTSARSLSKEFDMFNLTGEKTANLHNLLEWLESVPPTSVESERAFSAAGLFVTRLRTRLSDRSVNCLCFLRSFYKNE